MWVKMLDYFYRKDDQEIFSGRKGELSLMEEYLLSERSVDKKIGVKSTFDP